MSKVELARARIQEWRRNPVQFAVDVFGIEPDPWQIDAMSALGGDYNPSRRLCMKACTGPGKSATLAWMGWHRLLCFAAKGEHPKGAALSITADNLKDNLWAELSKWQQRSPLLKAAFTWTKEKIYANDHPETWFLSARSFAKDANAEAIGRALSGLHSQFPFVLLDETGDMPVAVGRAANQIFTGNPRDAAIIQAGNPTSTSGLLYESCTKASESWRVITITADPDDPKRTPRVSVEHATEMIRTYGKDNPWVMATILGLFPPTGFNALLGPDDIDASVARVYKERDIANAPVVIGGDVARQGDDASALARRQGRVAFPFVTMRIPDTMILAQQFIKEKREQKADAIFVDETGGYGAGVIDAMRSLKEDVIGVQFGGRPSDYRYFNKRSEMYFELAKWVKDGGKLPDDPELREELCATTFVYQGDKFRIVEKEIIKDLIGRSPDKADALALTFAYPVVKKLPIEFIANGSKAEYDPYSAVDRLISRRDHDPYS
jgi:phage terminase large subunit